MLYILSGEDDFSIARELDSIKKGIGDLEMLATNTNMLDGKQVTVDEFRAVCESAPFLSEKRLAIVHGLLGKFGTKTSTGRTKTVKKTEPQPANYEAFGNCIFKLPPSTILVLI